MNRALTLVVAVVCAILVLRLGAQSTSDAAADPAAHPATTPATKTAAQTFADHPVNVWVKQSPRADAPIPRFGWEGAGVYDPFLGKWLHWGGHDGIPQGFPMFWWDPATAKWQQLFPNTSPPGVCCVDGAQAFDLANRRFVRFPGASMGHGSQWSRSVTVRGSAVWLYEPATNTWSNMRPAPYKAGPKYSKQAIGTLNGCGAYDGKHQVSLSFGGQNSAGGSNNLFAYDAHANDFHRFDAAKPPTPRDGGGFCYDSANDCAVVFGSQYLTDAKTYLYRYATNAWEAHDLDPSPPIRKVGPYSTIPKMAYDSVNGISLCVAWLGEKEGHETWALDVAKMTWTKLSPTTEAAPSKSRSRNLVYDRGLNLFIMETMAVDDRPEVWTYRYKAAAPDPAPAPPTGLACITSADGKASLTWEPSAGAARYDVYRSQAEKPWLTKFEKLATTTEPRYQDATAAAGKIHFYTVRAINAAGVESREAYTTRTQPVVPQKPLVSVLAANRIEISWKAHPAADVVGYNLYRGVVKVATSTARAGSYGYNDPPYAQPEMDGMEDISPIEKLNDKPLTVLQFTDEKVNLAAPGAESGDYRFAVYAYILRAVNQWGIETGPSPYSLTIPSEPQFVLLRETKQGAEIKWEPNAEKQIAGYRIYGYGKPMTLLTPELVKQNTFTDPRTNTKPSRYTVVAVDVLGQEGEPSSPLWYGQVYKGFFPGDWHQ